MKTTIIPLEGFWRTVTAHFLVLVALAASLPAGERARAQQETSGSGEAAVTAPSRAEVQALVRQLDSHDRHQAIRALGELGTSEAQSVLLEIALGRRGAAHQEWAARCYVRSLTSKEKARELLQASNPEVVAIGLIALAKQKTPIDDRLLGELDRLLDSHSGYVRRVCAGLILNAPWHSRGHEMARIIIESIKTVGAIDHADRPLSYAGDLWTEYTEAGATYRKLIWALASAQAIALSDLVQLTPETPGIVRDCVLIARAWRNDSSVRPELYRIARKAEHPNLRAAALNGFSWIGTVQDLPFLEKVAATDPYRVKLSEYEKHGLQVYLPAGAPVPNYVYPNRRQAENLIRRIK
jgi:hypothetical protein